ncbi:protein FIZZY-RELATED 2-like [Andrographis paniculata]|uniref:protein FIZZY-RELATED 2-like n=1 Tax=Andrographis paniculata TaxID=175694 RepID=UPI0021E83278|nr:protein FIZZY-RELATED 2-like [Andrographis paniculata]
MKRSITSTSDIESKTPKLLNNSYLRRSSSREICGDRFIPSRSCSNFDLFNLPNSPHSAYIARLRSVLFEPPTPENSLFGDSNGCNSSPNRNIFKFKITRKSTSYLPSFELDDEFFGASKFTEAKIPTSPRKILDAPGLQDDFYQNLVDWSSQNVLAVGLGSHVYLWHGSTGTVETLSNLGTDEVCSVNWSPHGVHLAVGTRNGKIQLWDTFECKRIRTMEGHRSRVSTLAWSPTLLSSGSRDKSILQRDARTQEDYISKLNAHKSEVCGLKWSCDNRELASGGNDNRLYIWNRHSTQPVLKYCKHTGAVKAIAWSPHTSGLLASGGGTADRCIRFWNTPSNSRCSLSCTDTGSQVCNLGWSKNVNQLVSCHGYSHNQIIVWKYPSMSKLATLTGHTSRVLHLASSPDGQTIVTGAGDETLRFWNAFPPIGSDSQIAETQVGTSSLSLGRSLIR